MLTRDDVLEKAVEERVKFLRLQFTDTFGCLKNIAVTSEDLERAMAGRVIFDSLAVDGLVSNIEQDIVLQPDLSTFVVFPWRPREQAVARFICDINNPDGTSNQGCSRTVLKRVLDEVAQMGLEVQVGAKVEFYLFHTDDNGNPTVSAHDSAGFCDLTPLDQGENARRDLVLTLEEMGYNIGSSNHEVGPGQQKVSLKPNKVLDTADKLVTFKFIVRTIAQRHGLYASFMPKPLNGMPGSALHLHLYLRHRREAGVFFDDVKSMENDQVIGHFIGGVLNHASANTAITNPLVNSYKRLIHGDLTAPVYVSWSENSRNSVLRVIGRSGQKTRMEVRNPDPACNPYLALAVIIRAGLEGVRQKISQPSSLPENIMQTYNSLGQGVRVACLPRNLDEALRELASDTLVRNILGEYIYRAYTKAKTEEWKRFQAVVHPWELDEYLSRF